MAEKKGNRVIKNTFTAIVYEIIAVIAGLIVPKLILDRFGSSDNGVVSSVTQFLGFIVLLRSGIGGVAKAHLYKSLSSGDDVLTSKVMKATKKYMDKVSLIFLMSLICLSAVYPFVVGLPWTSTAVLVIICGLSSLAENYFGITNMIILQADRRDYIISIGNIIATVLNVIFTVVLVSLNFNIHMVKFGSSIAFCINPIFLYLYTKHKYKMIENVPYEKNLLRSQKDAFVHVVAEFIHRNTSVIILTAATNTLLVSVYTIYAIVTNGLRKLTNSFTANIEAVLGHLYNSDKDKFNRVFSLFEYLVFILGTIVYTICICLFVPFIKLYTEGVTDINYIRPIFAVLLCMAEFFDLIKTPYQFVIRIANRFKETKIISVMEAVLNLFISIVLVWKFDIIGVAIGMTVAMLWRSLAYAIYVKRQILTGFSFSYFRYMVVGILCAVVVFIVQKLVFATYANSYIQWFLQAIVVSVITCGVVLLLNLLFFRKNVVGLFEMLKKRMRF